MGSTANLAVLGGNLPPSLERHWVPLVSTRTGGLVARQHGQVARATLHRATELKGTMKKKLRVQRLCARMFLMTRKQVESAVASGLPFTLRMADGKEYSVPHRDYISLPPNASYVIVYDNEGRFTVLPLLTMTGLESKIAQGGNG